MNKGKYEDLRKSLRKHGLQYPIHRCKFGIIDGYKRSELLVGEQPSILDKGLRFRDHPEIRTIEQYLDLVDSMQSVQMTSEEKHCYIRIRSEELKNKGVSAQNIVKILKRITGLSKAQIYRIMPDGIKREYAKVSNETFEKKPSKKSAELISKIRSKYQFLDEVTILRGLKNPIILCEAVEQHFSTVKKVVRLDPLELEKVKADLVKEIPNDDYLFHPLLEEWEKLHPYKKIVVRDKTPEELENDS